MTEANWNEPFAALVQVDSEARPCRRRPRLKFARATCRSRGRSRSLSSPACSSRLRFITSSRCRVRRPMRLRRRLLTRPVAGSRAFSFRLLISFASRGSWRSWRFCLLYRFPEAQLVKLTTPFLLDPHEAGGLALTTGTVGFIYGTVGVIMLTLGGIIGGFVVARHGLGRWLWPMALAMHLPNLAFLFLAYLQPTNRWMITAGVGDRAVRLWLRLHGVHAVLRVCRQRKTSDRSLRAVHGLHGARHDDPRHVERLAAGTDRLSTLLRVDHDRDDSQLAGGGADSGGPDVWQEGGRRVG